MIIAINFRCHLLLVWRIKYSLMYTYVTRCQSKEKGIFDKTRFGQLHIPENFTSLFNSSLSLQENLRKKEKIPLTSTKVLLIANWFRYWWWWDVEIVSSKSICLQKWVFLLEGKTRDGFTSPIPRRLHFKAQVYLPFKIDNHSSCPKTHYDADNHKNKQIVQKWIKWTLTTQLQKKKIKIKVIHKDVLILFQSHKNRLKVFQKKILPQLKNLLFGIFLAIKFRINLKPFIKLYPQNSWKPTFCPNFTMIYTLFNSYCQQTQSI